jgi:hypothetical protein
MAYRIDVVDSIRMTRPLSENKMHKDFPEALLRRAHTQCRMEAAPVCVDVVVDHGMELDAARVRLVMLQEPDVPPPRLVTIFGARPFKLRLIVRLQHILLHIRGFVAAHFSV